MFIDFVKWRSVTNGASALLHTKHREIDGLPSLAHLIVVGVVSDDRPHLADLGNLSDYTKNLQDVKLQFTLRRPNGYIDFEDDFDIAIKRLRTLQNLIARPESPQSWFILHDGNLRFVHRLFHQKVSMQCMHVVISMPHIYTYKGSTSLRRRLI